MTPRPIPRRDCGRAEAAARLADAQAFLQAAELYVDVNTDVLASNAVLAGIAAADALTCGRLGERSASGDHAAAVTLLGAVDRRLAGSLKRLLAVKTKAQYSERDVSKAEAKGTLRNARVLVDAAEADAAR